MGRRRKCRKRKLENLYQKTLCRGVLRGYKRNRLAKRDAQSRLPEDVAARTLLAREGVAARSGTLTSSDGLPANALFSLPSAYAAKMR